LNEYTTYHYSVGEHSCLPSSSSSRSTTKIFTLDEIRWELETEHEFTAEEIPAVLGGLWTYHEFDSWLRKRKHYERSRYFAGDHGIIGRQQDNQNDDNRAGVLGEKPMTGVAYNSGRDRHHRYGTGRSSKRSKLDQHPPGEDAKPRAIDNTLDMHEEPRHMIDSDKQQEDDHEGEQDGSLDDLMKHFQQLLFHDSSSPAVLPESSQKLMLAWPTSAHASGPIPSSKSRTSDQQPEQQCVAIDTYLLPSSSPVSSFMSRMNLLNPVVLQPYL